MMEENTVVETTQAAPDAVPFWQPERGPNETFGDYRDRRRTSNAVAKNMYRKGTLFHDSSRLGTYIKN